MSIRPRHAGGALTHVGGGAGDIPALDLCRQITTQYPDTKVVLLTVYDDEHYLYQALRIGASGYILKRIDGQDLVGHRTGKPVAPPSSSPPQGNRLPARVA